MKTKIFNRGKGWYIFGTNYKDEKDKAYLNLYFPYEEPEYIQSEKGYSVLDINIEEAKFTSYKEKIGLTIFKYEQLTDIDFDKMGGSRSHSADNIIQPDDLPFY